MTFVPSPQQAAVFDFVSSGRGSAVVEAVAGSGKTTTLIEAVRRMKGSVAFAAYNKAIAVEIETRLKAAALPATVRPRAGTFHSFGFTAWRRANPKCSVNDRKLDLWLEKGSPTTPFHPFLKRLVSLAKQHAFDVLAPAHKTEHWEALVDHHQLQELLQETGLTEQAAVDHGIKLAQDLFQQSARACDDVIDFDDMIWAPLRFNTKLWMNDWVLVDEAQDTNPSRRALARRLLLPTGRLLAVGDPHQAIYGFTGADSNALDLIRSEFGAVTLPLSVTYRCPSAVVHEARRWVNHIEAADTAPVGEVMELPASDFVKAAPQPHDVVLCRNTKPLVELAFQLIRAQIPCHVEGRDIGIGLIALTRKWSRVRTAAALRTKLEEYLQREVAKHTAKGNELAAANVTDRVETLFVIMDTLPDDVPVEQMTTVVSSLFVDAANEPRPTLTLSTVHRSKGREWSRVFLWGAEQFMPSPFARQQWQLEQEFNLCYVAVTRAKQTLVYVRVPNRKEARHA